jgi:hypothetical protein
VATRPRTRAGLVVGMAELDAQTQLPQLASLEKCPRPCLKKIVSSKSQRKRPYLNAA